MDKVTQEQWNAYPPEKQRQIYDATYNLAIAFYDLAIVHIHDKDKNVRRAARDRVDAAFEVLQKERD